MRSLLLTTTVLGLSWLSQAAPAPQGAGSSSSGQGGAPPPLNGAPPPLVPGTPGSIPASGGAPLAPGAAGSDSFSGGAPLAGPAGSQPGAVDPWLASGGTPTSGGAWTPPQGNLPLPAAGAFPDTPAFPFGSGTPPRPLGVAAPSGAATDNYSKAALTAAGYKEVVSKVFTAEPGRQWEVSAPVDQTQEYLATVELQSPGTAQELRSVLFQGNQTGALRLGTSVQHVKGKSSTHVRVTVRPGEAFALVQALITLEKSSGNLALYSKPLPPQSPGKPIGPPGSIPRPAPQWTGQVPGAPLGPAPLQPADGAWTGQTVPPPVSDPLSQPPAAGAAPPPSVQVPPPAGGSSGPTDAFGSPLSAQGIPSTFNPNDPFASQGQGLPAAPPVPGSGQPVSGSSTRGGSVPQGAGSVPVPPSGTF